MSEIEEVRARLERVDGLFLCAALLLERQRLDEKIGPVKRPALA